MCSYVFRAFGRIRNEFYEKDTHTLKIASASTNFTCEKDAPTQVNNIRNSYALHSLVSEGMARLATWYIILQLYVKIHRNLHTTHAYGLLTLA
jgi:hypothetical protein